MPPTTTILDVQNELTKKEPLVLTQNEADYVDALKQQWIDDVNTQQKPSFYFNDKNLKAYLDRNERDSFLYVDVSRKDSWRSRTRRQTPRDKANAVIAAILDQNLQPEVFSFDEHGVDMREAADVAQTLIAYSDDVENADEKRKLRAFDLLKYGTAANEVAFVRIEKTEKRFTKDFDPATMEGKWAERVVADFEGIWTKSLPINRVILGDITKYFIREQPHIWKEYVLLYSEARQIFGNWKRWVNVTPVAMEYDSWTDTEAQTDADNQNSEQYVRVKVYMNKWNDEYAIFCNNTFMTPVGLPMMTSDKDYDIAWTQLDLYSSNYAYGRSFFTVLHNDSVIADFLYNALVDKARQGLEPPIVTSFRNLLNKNMFRPGHVSQGDVKFQRLIDHNGVTNADIEITKFIDENISKSSVSPVVQGQETRTGTTAYEIREQQKAALRILGLTLYSIARMERDIAEIKLPLILDHYPKLKQTSVQGNAKTLVSRTKTFVVRGEQARDAGVGRKEIEFGAIPESGKAAFAQKKTMYESEEKSRRRGEATKKILADPDTLRSLRYVFKIVANPAQRRSKIADSVEMREKYALYLANPMIDRKWATKMLLRSYDDDVEEAIAKEEPQAMAQPGAPQMPSMAPRKPTAEQTGLTPPMS